MMDFRWLKNENGNVILVNVEKITMVQSTLIPNKGGKPFEGTIVVFSNGTKITLKESFIGMGAVLVLDYEDPDDTRERTW